METLERLANAILAERDLDARQFTQDLWREYPVFSVIKKPTSQNIQVVTLCAALVELFAQRRKQSPPEWAALHRWHRRANLCNAIFCQKPILAHRLPSRNARFFSDTQLARARRFLGICVILPANFDQYHFLCSEYRGILIILRYAHEHGLKCGYFR